jgi:hypothetical protein
LRRKRKALKFRKATKSEIQSHLDQFHAAVKQLGKLGQAKPNAVEMARAQRDKDYYHD